MGLIGLQRSLFVQALVGMGLAVIPATPRHRFAIFFDPAHPDCRAPLYWLDVDYDPIVGIAVQENLLDELGVTRHRFKEALRAEKFRRRSR